MNNLLHAKNDLETFSKRDLGIMYQYYNIDADTNDDRLWLLAIKLYSQKASMGAGWSTQVTASNPDTSADIHYGQRRLPIKSMIATEEWENRVFNNFDWIGYLTTWLGRSWTVLENDHQLVIKKDAKTSLGIPELIFTITITYTVDGKELELQFNDSNIYTTIIDPYKIMDSMEIAARVGEKINSTVDKILAER